MRAQRPARPPWHRAACPALTPCSLCCPLPRSQVSFLEPRSLSQWRHPDASARAARSKAAAFVQALSEARAFASDGALPPHFDEPAEQLYGAPPPAPAPQPPAQPPPQHARAVVAAAPQQQAAAAGARKQRVKVRLPIKAAPGAGAPGRAASGGGGAGSGGASAALAAKRQQQAGGHRAAPQ
jgi:hypothetical protein